jgi:hypothetical protein
MNSEFLARWRALFFRRGGGSKSEARNLLCPKIQKEFLRYKIFCYNENVETIIISNVSRNGYSSYLNIALGFQHWSSDFCF